METSRRQKALPAQGEMGLPVAVVAAADPVQHLLESVCVGGSVWPSWEPPSPEPTLIPAEECCWQRICSPISGFIFPTH
jgi:hypothetical protein